MPTSASTTINCLFSHKCSERAHSIAKHLQRLVGPRHIDLMVDPFEIGDDVDIRMQTFDIEAVVFLCEPTSLSSEPVQLELDSAARQEMPIFTLHLEGEVPPSFKKRSYWHLPPLDSVDFSTGAERLAESIRRRVFFNRKVRLLYPENYFLQMSEVARGIAQDEDRTIIAEFACELARRYHRVSDPSTRYWIAIALGRADTPQAEKLLEALPVPAHPLESEGIREAREIIRHERSTPRP